MTLLQFRRKRKHQTISVRSIMIVTIVLMQFVRGAFQRGGMPPLLLFRPPSLSEEIGCSPTLSFLLGRDHAKEPYFFDPLQLATDDNFSRLREAELKCGRISMLAVIETVVMPWWLGHPKLLPWTFPPKDNRGAPLPAKVIDRVLAELSWENLAKVVGTCLVLECFVLFQRDPKDMPGDYGVGYFGVRNKGLHETKLVVELEHGRLAMLALVVQLALERMLDLSWDQQWAIVWKKLTEQT